MLEAIFETNFEEIEELEKRRITEEIVNSPENFSALKEELNKDQASPLLSIVLKLLIEKIQSKLEITQLRSEFALIIKEVQDLAETDFVTDLLNIRGFKSALEKRLEGNSRKALLYIDFNGFRSINNEFGHSAGDEALKKAASNFLFGVIRNTDLVARAGGDEFAILLEVENDQEVEMAMQRIINAFMENPVVIPYTSQDLSAFNPSSYKIIEKPDGTKEIQLTLAISIGGEWISSADDFDQIKAIADTKMYEAKEKAKPNGALAGSAYCFNGMEAQLINYNES